MSHRTGIRHTFALVALLIVTGAIHFTWIQLDSDPPYPDELRGLRDIEQGLETSGLPSLLLIGDKHPPALAISAMPIYAWTGDFDLARSINVVYLLIAIGGVYLLGRRTVSPSAGLGLATLAACAPFASTYSHVFLLEGPLGALLPYALLAAIESRGFARRWPAFLFGVCAGWMLLTKWTAVVFLIGPAALALIEGLRRAEDRRCVVGGVALALLGVSIAVPWYATHLGNVFDLLREDEIRYAIPPAWHLFESRIEPGSLSFYAFALDDILGIALAATAVVGMLLLLRTRGRSRTAVYALAVLIPAYVFFTLLLTKEARHLSPAAPALVFLGAAWVFGIRARAVRRIAFVALVLTTAAAGVLPALGVGPVRPLEIHAGRHLGLRLVANRAPPRRGDWRLDDVLAAIHSDCDSRGLTAADVVVLPNLLQLNHTSLGYTGRGTPKPALRILDLPDARFRAENLNDFDYIVTRTLPPGDWRDGLVHPRVQVARWLFGEAPPGPPPQLAEIGSFRLPDGYDAVVYRRVDRIGDDGLRALRALLGHDAPNETPAAIGSQRWWTAPPLDPRGPTLQVNAATDLIEIRGRPGEAYRLLHSTRRRRIVLALGVSELDVPQPVSSGWIGPNGVARTPVQALVASRSDARVLYFQALVGDSPSHRVTNWVAMTRSR